MSKTLTLEELEQQQAEAQARVEEARAAADEIRRRAEQRRAEAQHQHDEDVIAAWKDDRDALDDAITQARQRLREAVLTDPVWSAFREVILTGHRRTTRTMEYASAVGRVRGPEAAAMPIPHTGAPTWDELVRLVEDDATAQGRDEAQARDQAREDVGQAAADQEAGR